MPKSFVFTSVSSLLRLTLSNPAAQVAGLSVAHPASLHLSLEHASLHTCEVPGAAQLSMKSS